MRGNKKAGSTDRRTDVELHFAPERRRVVACIRLVLNTSHKYDGNMLDIHSNENVKKNDNEHVGEEWIFCVCVNFTFLQRKMRKKAVM